MTASRYFYADPLAAAWMRLHFGMLFEQGVSVRFGASPGHGLLVFNCRTDDAPPDPERYYIHADSVPLLVPQVGDLLYKETGCHWLEMPYNQVPEAIRKSWEMHSLKIIQRNGKPFHYPQSEQAP
jgi:hypothetical protein